jgi:hypothetical protein
MAWVWNEEEFCIDDPFDEPLGAPDNRDIGRLIAIVSGEHAEEHALGPVDAPVTPRAARLSLIDEAVTRDAVVGV